MSFEFPSNHTSLPWLAERTIYVTRHGSHAYGTNIETSDEDFRGVVIPPAEYFYGFMKVFKQAETKKHKQAKNEDKPEKEENASEEAEMIGADTDPDIVLFGITKFFNLASLCNPNALEILFTDPSDHLIVKPAGQILLENRHLFLSKRAMHTFSGYARSQMRRIHGHNRWLRDPIKAPPTRAEFGLPEKPVVPTEQLSAAFAAVQKVMDQWEWKDLDDLDPDVRIFLKNTFQERLLELTQWSWKDHKDQIWQSAAKSIGFDTNFIALLDQERRYKARLREWENYRRWVTNRNPKRADLEAKFGVDTKHLMHLCRLYTTVIELFETGDLKVRRPDAEWLLSIRNGSMSYEQAVEWTETQHKRLEKLYTECTKLPTKPDMNKLQDLCVRLVSTSL